MMEMGKTRSYEIMSQERCVQTVNFTSHDVAIIERALRTAIKVEHEEPRSRDYIEVLLKLQESAKQALYMNPQIARAEHDGITYDYDDSSDLM